MKKLVRTVEMAVGVVLQTLSACYVWTGGMPLWTLIPVVVLGALLLADGLSRLRESTRRLDFWLYFGLSLFVPVYGGVGSLLIGWRKTRGTSARLVSYYLDDTQSEEGTDNRQEDAQAGVSPDQLVYQELSIQSYMDIMRGSDRLLKKALIGKILQEWTPNAVALLKAALRDDVYEIRSYASTALTTIEDRMNRNIQDVKRGIQREPGDLSLKLRLAQGYLSYADSGLLDRSSSGHYARMAQDILEDAAEGAQDRDNLRVDFLSLQGRAARLLGDASSARACYQAILDLQPDHQETLEHMCEFYFQARDYGRLSDLCQRLLRVVAPDHPSAEAAGVWRPGDPPAQAEATP